MAMANEFSSSRIIAPMLTDCKIECNVFFSVPTKFTKVGRGFAC